MQMVVGFTLAGSRPKKKIWVQPPDKTESFCHLNRTGNKIRKGDSSELSYLENKRLSAASAVMLRLVQTVVPLVFNWFDYLIK